MCSSDLAGYFVEDLASRLLASVLRRDARREPLDEISCLLLRARARDGIVAGSPALVLDTDAVTILGDARVDLATEALAMDLRSRAKRGLGLSLGDLVNPLTTIGGTLARPRVGADRRGLIIEGGAAAATGGLSFLAKKVLERFLASDQPCTDLLARRGRSGAGPTQPGARASDGQDAERVPGIGRLSARW